MRGAGVRRAPQGPERAAADAVRVYLRPSGLRAAPRRAGAAGARRQGAPRANAAAAPAAIPSLRQFPEGGRVHPPPIEKGHLEYVQPTLVEALRGGAASPKPPWVEMREARSTTCADKTFETHVGPSGSRRRSTRRSRCAGGGPSCGRPRGPRRRARSNCGGPSASPTRSRATACTSTRTR